jgi:hypothetical protein
MKKVLSFIIICILASTIFGQPNTSSCHVDTSRSFSILFDISFNEDGSLSNYFGTYLAYYDEVTHQRTPVEDPYYCASFTSNWNGKYFSLADSEYIIQPKKIKAIEISAQGHYKGEIYNKTEFNLFSFEALNWLVDSPIESISISLTNLINVNIGLSRWPVYKQMINNNKVVSFKVEGSYLDENLIQLLSVFKNLEYLSLPEYLDTELLTFPNLRRVYSLNPAHFFSVNLINLNNLKNFGENNDKLSVQMNTTLELQFFLQETEAVYSSIHKYPAVHPINYVDSIIVSSIPELVNKNGFSLITCKMLPDYCHKIDSSDTIAFGNIFYGKPIGTWQYSPRFNGQNMDGFHSQFFEYNHDRVKRSVSIPSSGKWIYRYSDSTIAIEGNFQNGKKSGTWYFYNKDGSVFCVKGFNNDLPQGLFVNYSNPYWSSSKIIRTYYFTPKEYIRVVESNSGESYFFASPIVSKKRPYIINQNGSLSKYHFGKGTTSEISINSKKYKRILYKYYLKYLFPESQKGSNFLN